MEHLSQLPLLLTLALLPGCYSSSSSGSDDDTDTGTDTDTDSDTDTGTDGGWCGDDLDGDCPGQLEQLDQVLAASDIGDGVRFVAISHSGRAVLAERSEVDAEIPMIVVPEIPALEVTQIGLAEPESPLADPLTPVAVAEFGSDELPRYVALLCSESSCALWGTDVEGGETGLLVPVAGGEVPSSMTAARNLAVFKPGHAESVCVVGDGVMCFDGTAWTEEVAPGSGPVLNALDFFYDGDADLTLPVAVGEEGRVLVGTPAGWEPLESGTGETFVDVSGELHPEFFAIAGADGTLIVGGQDTSSWQYCQAAGDVTQALSWVSDSSLTLFLEVLTTGGTLLRIDEQGETCAFSVEVEGAPVGMAVRCHELHSSTEVLTETALYSKYLAGWGE